MLMVLENYSLAIKGAQHEKMVFRETVVKSC